MAKLLLDLYAKVARPWLDRVFVPSTCIEQSRVLIEVLKRFDISADGLGVKFIVTCAAKDYQFISGLDRAEREKAKRVVKSFVSRPRNDGTSMDDGRPDGLGRHVIVLVERHVLVDPTWYQSSHAKSGFVVDPSMMIVPFPRWFPEGHLPDVTVEGGLTDGTSFTVRWIGTHDRDWETDDGWEPSHLWPLIDRIEMDMRQAWERRHQTAQEGEEPRWG